MPASGFGTSLSIARQRRVWNITFRGGPEDGQVIERILVENWWQREELRIARVSYCDPENDVRWKQHQGHYYLSPVEPHDLGRAVAEWRA
jgi:hypothetical protein